MTATPTPKEANDAFIDLTKRTLASGLEGAVFSVLLDGNGAHMHQFVNASNIQFEAILFQLLMNAIARDEVTRMAVINALRAVSSEVYSRGLCNCHACQQRRQQDCIPHGLH